MITHTCDLSSAPPAPPWLLELQDLVRRGGPKPADHGRLRAIIDAAAGDVAAGRVRREAVGDFWRAMGPEFLADTIQGFGLSKPHGYAGDFEIIDRIHTQRKSSRLEFGRWDEFFHSEAAPKAVRNRAVVLGEHLTETCSRVAHPMILNVGSGPCRDVARWLSANRDIECMIECVDRDAKAHEYAQRVLDEHGATRNVRLTTTDILRFRPNTKYDLIWSAGLFDYLSDRLFVVLLRRLRSLAAPGARIVVGNFAPSNPSRNYMELFGEWYLNHRDQSVLLHLADLAGAASATVTSEAEGVNLFLIVRE